MTDKEMILAEIERKIKTLSPFSHQGSDTCGKIVRQLKSLIDFINSLPEETVSTPIDFEQELHKAFGQVKDFTLGMAIAKHFYKLGATAEYEYTKDLTFKQSQLAIKALNRKRVEPSLKGDTLHKFKDEWNTVKQIMHWYKTGELDLNYRLALHWASWGAQNLQGCFDMSEEEKAKLDTKVEPVSEELGEAAKNHAYSCYTDKASGERIAACIYDFKAGAKWMGKQGETNEFEVFEEEGASFCYMKLPGGIEGKYYLNNSVFKESDKVIVQIRKKKD